MKTCPRCGREFGCDVTKDRCWCKDLPPVQGIPSQYKDCLCPDCLAFIAKGLKPEPDGILEGEDFYYEKGLMVFTAKYHRERGSCCGNGCRHCPY